MEDKLILKYPVIVEGRYDKAKVSDVVSSPVITLDGFSVFNNEEKKLLLNRLSSETGVIVLADSDRAGNFIRSKLKGILKGKVYNVYAPCIKGKERRKPHPSADGLLGVEGIDEKSIYDLLKPFASEESRSGAQIDKARFYADGFSGGDNSSEKRAKLARELKLPETLTAKALLEAINLLVTYEEYTDAVLKVNNVE